MAAIKTPKKLIEVAIPLDDINAAAAREKSIRHGHPSTLHLWWARRPLAAARAVIFAQLVNDPGYQQGGGFKYGVNKKQAEVKREKLFKIIRDLVKWENTNNEEVLNRARTAIKESWGETCHLNRKHPQAAELFNPEKLPAFHDPFSGGGAIPLEAQRLGLESYASDLNPVAVMINKAMIEIPPRFSGYEPVGPIPDSDKHDKNKSTKDALEDWSGAKGLAEDVRRYGHWMREEAFKRIGHLYPKVSISDEMMADRPDLQPYAGQELTVIAWIWARTVKSPSPAFSHVDVPLVRSFILSTRKGKEAWVEPVIQNDGYRFVVRMGKPPEDAIKGTVLRTGGTCIISRAVMPFTYIRDEGKAGNISKKLMAVVAEGKRGRVYLSPIQEMEDIAESAIPKNAPESNLPEKALGFRVQEYGMLRHRDLFTPRQLLALATLSDLVQETRTKAIYDAKAAGMVDDRVGIDAGGIGATAYGDAMAVYLGLAVSKLSDAQSSFCRWKPQMDQSIATFGRQALPMVWDYSEANVFCGKAGDYSTTLKNMMKVLNRFSHKGVGFVSQRDAATQTISVGEGHFN